MSGMLRQTRRPRRRGFTLMEILIATALALLLMAAVVRLFASVTSSVTESRAVIEVAQSLQSAQTQLQNDLRYATARGVPPFDPADQKGYLEIIDGPGPYVITGLGTMPLKADEGGALDSTVGDMDDILMMTVRSYGEPFYGRWFNPDTSRMEIIQSQDAEIAWFTRGNKLHRRVRLIAPGRRMDGASLSGAATLGDNIGPGFARTNDVAVRLDFSYGDPRFGLASYNAFKASSLGDLTKRENRFGHDPFAYPHDARFWGEAGLPTQGDTSHVGNPAASSPVPQAGPWTQPMPWGFAGDNPLTVNAGQPDFLGYHFGADYWRAPYEHRDSSGNVVASPIHPSTGSLAEYRGDPTDNSGRSQTGDYYLNADSQDSVDAHFTRYSEDIVLGNVIGFDVKIWDPTAPVFVDGARVVKQGDPGYLTPFLTDWIANGQNPADPTFARYGSYVDLYYTRSLGALPGFASQFSGPGVGALRATNHPSQAAVYDTGSLHYEQDGVDQFNDNSFDLGMDGIDNDNDGVVDEFDERETVPPYPFAVRSIEVKIRVFELDSRIVREVTVAHDLVD